MVTFSCDICADVFKKPKAMQHIYRCPSARLTCIDCSTTFHGDDYLKHTSCISEAEKYQKSLYKANKKHKQDQTPNKQKQQKFGTQNDNNKQYLENREKNDTSYNDKALKSSEQDQTPNTTTNINHSQNSKDNCTIEKKKYKNKKDQRQGNQHNGVKEEKERKKDIVIKAIDGDNNEMGTTEQKYDSDPFVNNSKKKKRKKNKKSSINDDNKVKRSEKDNDNDIIMKDLNELMCIDYSQSVQTYENPNPKKENNVENLNSSSGKKKKKERNDFINNNNLANLNGINDTNEISHEQDDDKKDKKRKSTVFMQGQSEPETPIDNKKVNNEQSESENRTKVKKRKTNRQSEPETPIDNKKKNVNNEQSEPENQTKIKKRKTNRQSEPETLKNKKQEANDDSRKAKKSKSGHENVVTHNLSNNYESISATVRKIFKSNNHEELNLKRLEEMVACELNSNLSASEVKEKFLENIVLVMKDGNIILK